MQHKKNLQGVSLTIALRFSKYCFKVVSISLILKALDVGSKFLSGGRGGRRGGGNSERCLKWGGGGGRSLRNLSKNILK